MSKKKYFFRYPVAARFMLISFCIGYLSIFYGTNILATVNKEDVRRSFYKYENEAGYFLLGLNHNCNLDFLCKEKEYHIAIQNFSIYDKKNRTAFLLMLLLVLTAKKNILL